MGRRLLFIALVYIIVLIVYWLCPRIVKLPIFIANCFLPDPLPYVDETIMVLGLLKGK